MESISVIIWAYLLYARDYKGLARKPVMQTVHYPTQVQAPHVLLHGSSDLTSGLDCWTVTIVHTLVFAIAHSHLQSSTITKMSKSFISLHHSERSTTAAERDSLAYRLA